MDNINAELLQKQRFEISEQKKEEKLFDTGFQQEEGYKEEQIEEKQQENIDAVSQGFKESSMKDNIDELAGRPVAAQPKYIGFDRRFTHIEAEDSERMVAVKKALAVFHDEKKDVTDRIALDRLIEACNDYCKGRFAFFKAFRKAGVRLAEVKSLREQATARRDALLQKEEEKGLIYGEGGKIERTMEDWKDLLGVETDAEVKEQLKTMERAAKREKKAAKKYKDTKTSHKKKLASETYQAEEEMLKSDAAKMDFENMEFNEDFDEDLFLDEGYANEERIRALKEELIEKIKEGASAVDEVDALEEELATRMTSAQKVSEYLKEHYPQSKFMEGQEELDAEIQKLKPVFNRNRILAARYKNDIQKVKIRASVDINDKKHLEYRTFEQLSEFAPLLGKESDLAKLCTSYGLALKSYKKSVKEEDTETAKKIHSEEISPVLDELTNVILSIDTSAIDLSSDELLIKNASDLETMSKAVSAYMDMIHADSDYINGLFAKKYGDSDATWGDKLLPQLERLNAISEYYRIRRLVIEDEYYALNGAENISYEETAKDNSSVRRLKRNMRASMIAADHMNRLLGKPAAELPEFKEDKTKEMLTKESYSGKESVMEYLKGAQEKNSYVLRLENERYLQAPVWMQNALTVDPEELKKKMINKDAGFGVGTAVTDSPQKNLYLKRSGRENLINEYNALKQKKTNSSSWGDSPRFYGGKDQSMESIAISDNWDRANAAYCTEYSYLRSDEEMIEMLDILSIQKNTEEWDKIKEDPDAADFYESAYQEMLMKNVSMVYTSAKRLSDAIIGKFMVLHPADLVKQMSVELRAVIMNNAILTNVTEHGNPERLEAFFKEHDPQGKYLFDKQGLKNMDALATMNFKLIAVGSRFAEIINGGEEEEEEFYAKARKEIFGDENFVENVLTPEYEAHEKEAEAEGFKGKKPATMLAWYLTHHPELMTEKQLNTKVQGKYVFQEALQSGVEQYFLQAEGVYRDMLKNKEIDLPSDEELDKYEQSLKDRKLFAIRADKPDDPNPDKEITVGKVGDKTYEVLQKDISEKKKKDPYGIHLVRTAMEDLVVKDKKGNTVMDQNNKPLMMRADVMV